MNVMTYLSSKLFRLPSLRRGHFLVCSLLFGLVHSMPVQAQDNPKGQIPARTELHSFQSLTISDAAFLKGEDAGTPVTLAGELRVAQGAGRMPVVVLVHGSSGIGSNTEVWARQFNEMGVSAFILDSFTGRGLTVVGPDQSQLGRLNLSLDAYRALEVLAKHPRVDPKRIVLMGFSRGGQATLYASENRFLKAWNRSGLDFAAYLPFYPDCHTAYQNDTDVADRPIRIFHGTADDYNPAPPCKAFVQRLRSAGRNVEMIEYAGAQHSFDSPLGPTTPTVSKNAQTVRNCRIKEEPVGRLINAVSGAPFTYADACVERDPHVGYDPNAAQAAHRYVGEFLGVLFRVKTE
jgi:dienelactone hydrolase